MVNIVKRLEEGAVVVADGAIGSLLLSRDIPKESCPEIYNLTHPEVLQEIAAQYLNAGAEIIQANTFGASPLKLASYGLEKKMAEINSNAVIAVKKAVGEKAYVAGSCGPCGKILKPYGDTDPDDLYQSFFRQIEVLISAGVDLICVETMTDITEAVLVIKAAKEIAPAIPVIGTMTFDVTSRGFFTIMGVDIRRAVKELEATGTDIIGSNCGNGIVNMIEIAKEFKKYTDRPLIIQANAGLPELKDGKPVYQETPEFMAKKSKELIEAGVSIIGGCCGTTPDHIAAFRKTIDVIRRMT